MNYNDLMMAFSGQNPYSTDPMGGMAQERPDLAPDFQMMQDAGWFQPDPYGRQNGFPDQNSRAMSRRAPQIQGGGDPMLAALVGDGSGGGMSPGRRPQGGGGMGVAPPRGSEQYSNNMLAMIMADPSRTSLTGDTGSIAGSLGDANTVAKEKNQLNVLFQGALAGQDLDKARRLAVTPEQQAALSVAEGQSLIDRENRGKQAKAESDRRGMKDKFVAPPTNLMGDYRKMQELQLNQGNAREDRASKLAYQGAQTRKLNADAMNLEVKPLEPAPIQVTDAQGNVRMFDRSGNLVKDLGAIGKRTPTAGQAAADREFGKAYADYQAGGGSADVEKQLGQLEFVSSKLGEKGNDYTGSVKGLVPDKLRAISNPEAVAAKNKVEEVAQRNLRLVLGAQFTQVEGERLIARAYNDQMPPAENKKRVDALITQIRTAAKTKEDAARYFEKNGTLSGWQGRMPNFSDFEAAVDNAGKSTTDTSAHPTEIQALLKKYG